MEKYIYPPRDEWKSITARPPVDTYQLQDTVRTILEDVRLGGDDAVKRYEKKFDNASLDSLIVTEDEINEDSWLVDSDGVQQAKGKEYTLMGYNDQGKEREVYFTKTGSAEEYYAPGTYIRVDASRTLVVGLEVVDEASVPQAALEKINTLGTKIK